MEAGKRGPTGDTGRVGDTGRTGDTGAEGGVGETGAAGAAGTRGAEGPRNSRGLLWVIAVGAVLLLVITAVMSTVTLYQSRNIRNNAATIKDLERESNDRRDQSCRGLELGHKQEIVDLGRTYRFYADPPPEFENLLKNPLVLEGLRDDERNARNDQDRFGVYVPAYCDEPGYGLSDKHGDPKMPERPPGLPR